MISPDVLMFIMGRKHPSYRPLLRGRHMNRQPGPSTASAQLEAYTLLIGEKWIKIKQKLFENTDITWCS